MTLTLKQKIAIAAAAVVGVASNVSLLLAAQTLIGG